MPMIHPRPEALEAHLRALRLIGVHGGSFRHTCAAATCTRRAHWRYFSECNPRLAEMLIVCGAYEVYEIADEDGYASGRGYVVLERADGPSGSLYVASKEWGTLVEALRYACEMAVENIRQETEGQCVPPPAPVPGIPYAPA